MSMMMMAPHALLAAPLTTIPSSSSSFSSSSSISSVSSLQNALFPLSFSPLRLQKRCSAPSPTRMSLKIVHTYDSSFELKPEVSLSLPTYKFYVIIHFFELNLGILIFPRSKSCEIFSAFFAIVEYVICLQECDTAVKSRAYTAYN